MKGLRVLVNCAPVRRHVTLTCGFGTVVLPSDVTVPFFVEVLSKPLSGLSREHWTRNCALGCRKVMEHNDPLVLE